MRNITIVVLSIGWVPVTVHAASNVTLYGIADAGLQYIEFKGEGARLAALAGGQTQSRWGLRGEEALGGGIAAMFQLENGFDLYRGTIGQGGRMFGRAAWVGLKGPFGQWHIGRQTLAATDFTGIYSPFGRSFKLAGGGGVINSNTTPRADNAIKYVSPTVNGMQGTVSYALDAHLAQNADGLKRATVDSRDRVLSLAGRYRHPRGQLVAYYQRTWLGADTRTAGQHWSGSPQEYGIGGTLPLGPRFTLHAAFAQHRDAYINGHLALNTGQASLFKGGRVNGYTLGLTTKVGTSRVLTQLALSDPHASVRRGVAVARAQKIYSLGVVHPLSKRTNVYAYGSYLDGAWFDNPKSGVAARDWHAVQLAMGMRYLF